MPARCDYLLRFQPLFRRYLWGGRRLAAMLGKPLGEGDDYAESWEIVDHGADQSVVRAGPLAGQALGELVRNHRRELLGEVQRAGSVSARSNESFPLLFKFLDCNRTLSVQVHPNDQQAAELHPPDLGKTEAWVVLHAEPGSKIYSGLKEGVTREALAAAIDAGRVEECLHSFDAKAGDCVFIPAGTVHALGAGLVIAEIQQASDTTFRLFDWNRVDATGKPRPLHVDQSLAVIDYATGPVAPQMPRRIAPGVERLVECDKFVLQRREAAAPTTVGGDGRFHLLAVIEGQVQATSDPLGSPLARGMTALVPAAAGPIELKPQGRAVVLDIFLPG
ncbi:MAG TPA: type I phosphomannose isomerase catalytic subunit [Lacipirellula sp.]